MNDDQRLHFRNLVKSCASGALSSLNVASKVRSDAIVAAASELRTLRQQRDDLLEVCKALVEPQYVGISYSRTWQYWACAYCNVINKSRLSLKHRPDCPIQVAHDAIASETGGSEEEPAQ